jgi:hypothetical protein
MITKRTFRFIQISVLSPFRIREINIATLNLERKGIYQMYKIALSP